MPSLRLWPWLECFFPSEHGAGDLQRGLAHSSWTCLLGPDCCSGEGFPGQAPRWKQVSRGLAQVGEGARGLAGTRPSPLGPREQRGATGRPGAWRHSAVVRAVKSSFKLAVFNCYLSGMFNPVRLVGINIRVMICILRLGWISRSAWTQWSSCGPAGSSWSVRRLRADCGRARYVCNSHTLGGGARLANFP